MKTKLFLPIIIATLMCGCGEPTAEIRNINKNNCVSLNVDDLSTAFSDISVVELETSPECLMGNIKKVIRTESRLLVLAEISGGDRALFAFDVNGKFIMQIGRQGQANNEYLRLQNFFIDEKSNNITIMDSNGKKFIEFDKDGQFIKSVKYTQPLQFIQSIEQIEDGEFLFANTINFVDNVLFGVLDEQYDSVKKISSTSLTSTGSYEYSISPFSRAGKDKFYMVHPVSDTLWLWHENNITPYCVVELSDEKLDDLRGDYSDCMVKNINNKNIIMGVVWVNDQLVILLKNGCLLLSQDKCFFIEDNGVNYSNARSLLVPATMIRKLNATTYYTVMSPQMLNMQIASIEKNTQKMPRYFENIKMPVSENNNPCLILFKIDQAKLDLLDKRF